MSYTETIYFVQESVDWCLRIFYTEIQWDIKRVFVIGITIVIATI